MQETVPLRRDGLDFYVLTMLFDSRNGVDKGVRVFGLGMGKYFVGSSALDNLSFLHHHDTVGEEFDYRKVVSDKEVSVIVLSFEVVEEVEYLGLDADIEGRDTLVAHYQFGL